MGVAALPALLPHWSRATSWCVSNCDRQHHAAPILKRLGLATLHADVLQAVPNYATNLETAQKPPPLHVHGGRAQVREASWFTSRWPSLQNMHALTCLQSYLSPSEAMASGEQWGMKSWDRCLNIAHSHE